MLKRATYPEDVDPTLPEWKRELILRKCAVSKYAFSDREVEGLEVPTSSSSSRHGTVSHTEYRAGNRKTLASNKGTGEGDFHLHVSQTRVKPGCETAGRGSKFRAASEPRAVWGGGNMRLETIECESSDLSGIVENKIVALQEKFDPNIKVNRFVKTSKSKMGEEKKFGASRTGYPDGECGKKDTGSDRVEQPFVRNRLVSVQSDENSHEEYHSDSSEELQYGPGIVKKLKSKYLSMTLRETQKGNRPSILNLRRATSLENMLESDEVDLSSQQPNHISKIRNLFTKRVDGNSYHRPSCMVGDSLKRVRSVEALLQLDVKQSLISHCNGEKKTMKTGLDLPVKLVNEDIIIIENKKDSDNEGNKINGDCNGVQKRKPLPNGLHGVEEDELPPQDVVKQTVRIFEPSPRRISRKSGVAAKVANKNLNGKSVAPKPPIMKPSFPPKPSSIVLQRQKPVSAIVTPKKTPVSNTQQNTSSVIPVNGTNAIYPVKVDSNDGSPIAKCNDSPVVKCPDNKASLLNGDGNVNIPLTNGNVDTTLLKPEWDDENEDEETGTKLVSKVVMDNIRKDGVSVQINFNKNNKEAKSYLPSDEKRNASSQNKQILSPIVPPKVISLQQKPGLEKHDRVQKSDTPKQVGVIKPITKAEKTSPLTEREIEKNLINKVKSVDSTTNIKEDTINSNSEKELSNTDSGKVLEETVSKIVLGEKGPRLWDKEPWHQKQNTMVFNFVAREKVPDYIEDDGLILKRRSRKGEGGFTLNNTVGESSDFEPDADLSPPSPCNVMFEGANVLINGKSSFQKLPKSSKLHISFNDDATTTYEYPSEASLLEEPSPASTTPETESALSSNEASTATSPGSGLRTTLGSSLASYTPSKIQIGEGFELGVTRTVPQPPPQSSNAQEKVEVVEEEEYLKPAEDSETVAWSSETASDILF